MFYLIGLGLGDVKDITVKGLEAVRSCDRVYLEAYTSILCYGPQKEELESFLEKSVILADRELVEQQSDEILDDASHSNVCMLPYSIELFSRANINEFVASKSNFFNSTNFALQNVLITIADR